MNPFSFYQNLPAFQDFSKISEDQFFFDVPDDWYVILTDVRGSTKAIEEGRYKHVNIIGAASITCILNCLKSYDFPFVFGGDGATILMPAEFIGVVKEQLKGLQALSKTRFNLELRVGLVAVKELYKQGHKLKIGKYELSPGNVLAQFRGSALTRAEEMVKKSIEGADIVVPDLGSHSPLLEGLSCRLNPLKSNKGLILSILCKPMSDADTEIVLQYLVRSLRKILKDDFKSASPVQSGRLRWKWISPTLKEETFLLQQLEPYWKQYLKTLAWVLISNTLLLFNIPLGGFRPKKYKVELQLNSDFKKFDETLRMVIDCDLKQAGLIEVLLEKLYQDKKIYYGIHKSKEALMTCMVYSATANQHTHFIDGSDGGYAMAAVGLKKQMARG